MLNNTRYLHLLLSSNTFEMLESFNPHQLKKKFPGEHIALVRSEDEADIRALDLFHEIHTIDLSFLQKCAFSPLLGDATAFNVFWKTVHPLTETTWTRIFNLAGSQADTMIASLFKAPVMGSHEKDGKVICLESPLKLARTLKEWNLEHPLMTSWLQKRSLQQLELAPLEKTLQQINDMKSLKGRGELKGVLVGVRLTDINESNAHSLDFIHHLFSLVSLDQKTSEQLKARGYAFWDWSESDPQESLFLDLIVQDHHGFTEMWAREVDITHKDPEELTDLFADILPRNFSKWACLSFLFDYLGQQKLALTAEKILTRYDRQTLQPFLHQEVLQLKDFAKVLLDGIRRQGQNNHNVLAEYWKTHPGTLSFMAAIELSLQPSVVPMFRHDQDVLSIKNRMRTLNAFYERMHKACTLEIPKTDLALTL